MIMRSFLNSLVDSVDHSNFKMATKATLAAIPCREYHEYDLLLAQQAAKHPPECALDSQGIPVLVRDENPYSGYVIMQRPFPTWSR